MMESNRVTKQSVKEEKEPKSNQKIRIRLIPIWLRLIIVVVLMAVMVIIGAIVGYAVIGNGNFLDVFKPSTWTHIVDLVNKDT